MTFEEFCKEVKSNKELNLKKTKKITLLKNELYNFGGLGYMNSLSSNALKVGSVKVSTINLARIAYESENNESKFISILTDRLIVDMKILDVVRDVIKRNVEKGLLPNFQEGLLDFDHLYNTVGINGIYEVMKSFGYTYKDEFDNTYYSEEAMKFGKKIFDTIHKTIAEFVVDKDYKVNVEQIPGETAAVKFIQADSLLFGKMTCCQGLKTNDLFINFTLNNEDYSVPSDYKFTLSDGSKETIENIIDNNLDVEDKELAKFKV